MKTRALLANLAEADLRLLRVFIAIADSRGLAAAELRLNISRSVISRHLKDLESRLGVRLCERGRAGFALTEEGEVVLAAAQRLLAQIDAFRNEIAELHTGIRGEINLVVFDKFATNPACKVSEAIEAFGAEAPGVIINLYVGGSTEIERGLLDGRYHLGIQPFHRASESFDAPFLFAEAMYLYCAPHHPLAARAGQIEDEEIRAHPFVGLGYHSPNMELFWRLDLKATARAYDQEGSVALVRSGRYLGFLPDHYAEAFERRGELLRIPSDVFRYTCEWHLFVPRGLARTRATRRFEEVLLAHHGAAPA